MKFIDLKFGQKLGLGFGLLIIIAATLGIIAVVNMQSISKRSKHLAQEYVPEVKVANSIERTSLQTMYAMRGYAFSEEERFLTQGNANLEEVKRFMGEAEQLARSSTQLKALQGAIDQTKAAVGRYESLANQTVETNQILSSLRQDMDDAGSKFLKNCTDFLDNQNRNLSSEINQGATGVRLKERHDKITWINDLIDKGNEVRVTNFKAQATRDVNAYEAAIDQFNIEQELRDLRSITRQNADIQALNNLEDAANNYIASMEEFLTAWKTREDLNAKRTEAGEMVLAQAQEVSLAGIDNTSNIANEAVTALGVSSTVMVIGLLIAMIIGILLAYVITRSMTSGLKRGVKFATQVSEGDLTANLEEVYLHRKDEIGMLSRAMTNMVNKLRDIVENILNGSEGIAGASGEMASTSQELSQGASEQAASVEQVSSSMEEMVSNIQQNTDNAQQTEKIAMNAVQGIREGSSATNTAVEAMKNIADKIKIINDIAFQTNILALNAAVEAARAGEHGKGFAVVAAEVRKLAERSKIAADEIDDLSASGVEIAEKAGIKLNEMVPEIEKTAKLVQEIAAASIEQNSGADQINNAIQQLNTITQQNASASEEMATSAEELSGQSDQLRDTIMFFKVDRMKKVQSQMPKRIKGEQLEKKEKVEKHSGAAIDLKEFQMNDAEYENF